MSYISGFSCRSFLMSLIKALDTLRFAGWADHLFHAPSSFFGTESVVIRVMISRKIDYLWR